MSLLEKLKKNSRIESADVLADSIFYGEKDSTPTPVPMINVALSGDTDGGLSSGLTVLAGPSKHFKTSFALLMAAAYLKKHKEAVLLFYDSEFGSPQAYFESFGIDPSRVLHTPIMNVEELKFDIINQLENIDRKDKVCIIIDSLGNVASKKELEDAKEAKSVADMSRAKALKGLFRMVTPYLTLKDIPCIAINHTYMEQGLYPKAIVSGGTGIYYSANTIWILGRRQDKDADGVQGYHFVINVEKSRFVREKSQIPISVSWEGGIEVYSGLLDVAIDAGYVVKPSMGWYQFVDPKTKKELSGKLRAEACLKGEYWEMMFKETDFKKYLKDRYSVGHKEMIAQAVSSTVDSEDEE